MKYINRNRFILLNLSHNSLPKQHLEFILLKVNHIVHKFNHLNNIMVLVSCYHFINKFLIEVDLTNINHLFEFNFILVLPHDTLLLILLLGCNLTLPHIVNILKIIILRYLLVIYLLIKFILIVILINLFIILNY